MLLPRAAQLALVVTCILPAPAVAHAAQPRNCGSVTLEWTSHGMHSEGAAMNVRAARVTCSRARAVARACIRGSHAGWHLSEEPLSINDLNGPARTRLDRGEATLSFQVAGGGGCA